MRIKCCDEDMKLTQTDSRQFWFEETFECEKCGKIKVHRREFDELGLVTLDEIREA